MKLIEGGVGTSCITHISTWSLAITLSGRNGNCNKNSQIGLPALEGGSATDSFTATLPSLALCQAP